jgi:hypothetical protein
VIQAGQAIAQLCEARDVPGCAGAVRLRSRIRCLRRGCLQLHDIYLTAGTQECDREGDVRYKHFLFRSNAGICFVVMDLRFLVAFPGRLIGEFYRIDYSNRLIPGIEVFLDGVAHLRW